MNNQAGFTLPELLIAIMISSIVIGGLAGIGGNAARTQARDYRHGMLGNNVVIAMKHIQNAVDSSLEIIKPASGPGAVLCVRRCDPSGPDCKDPHLNLTWLYKNTTLCYRDKSVYRYPVDPETTGPACGVVDSGNCGLVLAGYPPDKVATFIQSLTFTRSGNFSNTVDVTIQGFLDSGTFGTETVNQKSSFTSPGQPGNP